MNTELEAAAKEYVARLNLVSVGDMESAAKDFIAGADLVNEELKKANEFICDIAKLLGEDNLGVDGCAWSIDDFEEAIKRQKAAQGKEEERSRLYRFTFSTLNTIRQRLSKDLVNLAKDVVNSALNELQAFTPPEPTGIPPLFVKSDVQEQKGMRWIKAKTLIMPLNGEEVFIRYNNGTEKEIGYKDYIIDRIKNGWPDVEWLCEDSPVSNVGDTI